MVEFYSMACRHLGRFFKIAVEYNLDQVDFVMKALKSEYKEGIEKFYPQWYSQSPYYYFEEFLEDNAVKKTQYSEEEKLYEQERMYWLGYCLQSWSNRANLKGEDILKYYDEKAIKQLLNNYKVYHTVDPLVVLEDTIDINNIALDFNKLIDGNEK